jgi:rSAM/selenodomain-associated transferase 1
MAKEPRAGRVKTRLCPPCSPEEAAAVAEAALADTLAAVASCGAARKILALDGRPGPWLPRGFELIPQRGRDFNERLANAWHDAGGGGLQIGMDTPQITAFELDALLAELDRSDAVLGHAVDGGWWLIGWRHADPKAMFDGIPMSSAATGRAQEARIAALGLRLHRAPAKRDIDTIDDLRIVAARHPRLRTARVARSLARPAAVTA